MLVHMMLEAAGLRVLVVGGGAVAARMVCQAVASGGRLPFLTKQFKAELKQFLAAYEQKYDAQTIELLTELRRRIIAELDGQPQQKKMLLHRLAVLAGRPDKLKARLQDFGLKQSGGYNGNISAIIDWLQGEPAGAGADAAGGGAD